MNIIKCDICNKTIKKNTKSIHLGIGGFFGDRAELCEKCGAPVLKLLCDKKLIKNENKQNGQEK